MEKGCALQACAHRVVELILVRVRGNRRRRRLPASGRVRFVNALCVDSVGVIVVVSGVVISGVVISGVVVSGVIKILVVVTCDCPGARRRESNGCSLLALYAWEDGVHRCNDHGAYAGASTETASPSEVLMLMRAAGNQPRRWRGVVGSASSRLSGLPAVLELLRAAELGERRRKGKKRGRERLRGRERGGWHTRDKTMNGDPKQRAAPEPPGAGRAGSLRHGALVLRMLPAGGSLSPGAIIGAVAVDRKALFALLVLNLRQREGERERREQSRERAAEARASLTSREPFCFMRFKMLSEGVRERGEPQRATAEPAAPSRELRLLRTGCAPAAKSGTRRTAGRPAAMGAGPIVLEDTRDR